MNSTMNSHPDDLRFSFGKNWKNFSAHLSEERISEAEKSLKKMLRVDDLTGKNFLDIGCGSGLFSLAAANLGASVFSFDYDQDSVDCAMELKKKFANVAERWTITQGSVLDQPFLDSLGVFDIVYSWGVLHHTGAMYEALERVVPLVKSGGMLFISIYNDQGSASKRWLWIKKTYNRSGPVVKHLLTAYTAVRTWMPSLLKSLLRGKSPLKLASDYKNTRGMSAYYDLIDWVGGYPFEVAKPEEIVDFFHSRQFQLVRLKTCGGGLGCNEFLFQAL